MSTNLWSPSRDDLCRSVSFRANTPDEPNDGFTLDGYGAVFNSPTRIDSWEGRFDEICAPGAFRKSLRENTPKMQFDHGHHPLIGSIPIGRFDTIEEDTHGLHVVGRLSDNWLIEPVRQAIADGGIDGMSFRFSVVRDQWTDKDGKQIKDERTLWELMSSSDDAETPTRTLKEVRVSEVGPVVWPAYAATSVGVRSMATAFGLTSNNGGNNRQIIIDLGSRESLARAAFVIDAAVRNTGPVGEAEQTEPEHNDAPSTTNDEAVRHSEEPPNTSVEAGEHPSGESGEDRRARILARNREYTERMSAIKAEGGNYV